MTVSQKYYKNKEIALKDNESINRIRHNEAQKKANQLIFNKSKLNQSFAFNRWAEPFACPPSPR